MKKPFVFDAGAIEHDNLDVLKRKQQTMTTSMFWRGSNRARQPRGFEAGAIEHDNLGVPRFKAAAARGVEHDNLDVLKRKQ